MEKAPLTKHLICKREDVLSPLFSMHPLTGEQVFKDAYGCNSSPNPHILSQKMRWRVIEEGIQNEPLACTHNHRNGEREREREREKEQGGFLKHHMYLELIYITKGTSIFLLPGEKYENVFLGLVTIYTHLPRCYWLMAIA